MIAKRPRPMLITTIFAVTLVLASVLVACTNAVADKVPDIINNSPPVQTVDSPQEPEISSLNSKAWLEAYTDVLTSGAEFTDAYTKRQLDVEHITQAVTDDENLTAWVQKFTVIDLDNDGTPEVVLELLNGGMSHVGSVILRYYDGVVYGYTLYARQFYSLKADGTYTASQGVLAFGTMRFDENEYYNDWIASYDTGYDADGNPTSVYYVKGEIATEEAFLAAGEEQEAKPDAPWHAFTEANVNTVLPLWTEGGVHISGNKLPKSIDIVITREGIDEVMTGSLNISSLFGYAIYVPPGFEFLETDKCDLILPAGGNIDSQLHMQLFEVQKSQELPEGGIINGRNYSYTYCNLGEKIIGVEFSYPADYETPEAKAAMVLMSAIADTMRLYVS